MKPTDIAALIVIHDWIYRHGSGHQLSAVMKSLDDALREYVRELEARRVIRN